VIKAWKRRTKVLIAAVAGVLLILGALVAYVSQSTSSAERNAKQFCDEIALGSDIAPALAMAKDRKILYGLNEQTYTFYFPTVALFDKAICEVSVSSDGRALSKGSVMEYD
jgi:hypothetical protein